MQRQKECYWRVEMADQRPSVRRVVISLERTNENDHLANQLTARYHLQKSQLIPILQGAS